VGYEKTRYERGACSDIKFERSVCGQMDIHKFFVWNCSLQTIKEKRGSIRRKLEAVEGTWR
jgi:hypothetical protein